MWNRKLCQRLLVALALVVGSASVASAQPSGGYLANFKFGPAIGVNDAPGQLALGLEFGTLISAGSRSRVYLILPLEFGVGGGRSRIQLEPAVEVDVHLPVGVPLYLAPRAGLGLGIMTGGDCGRGVRGPGCDADFAFAFNLGVGVKYVLNNLVNFSFEPLRLDFWPVGSAQSGIAPVWYSMLFGVGINF